jgi:hypothetical protein
MQGDGLKARQRQTALVALNKRTLGVERQLSSRRGPLGRGFYLYRRDRSTSRRG